MTVVDVHIANRCNGCISYIFVMSYHFYFLGAMAISLPISLLQGHVVGIMTVISML